MLVRRSISIAGWFLLLLTCVIEEHCPTSYEGAYAGCYEITSCGLGKSTLQSSTQKLNQMQSWGRDEAAVSAAPNPDAHPAMHAALFVVYIASTCSEYQTLNDKAAEGLRI